MSKPTQDLNFWKDRIAKADTVLDAMGYGFNWSFLNSVHKPIIDSFVDINDTVLDVGCGPGRTAHWFDKSKYTGIDFVPEFIAEARRLHPDKNFIEKNFVTDDLPFEAQQFDWAILISVKIVIAPAIGRNAWDQVEWKLRKCVKKGILIFEYGNSEYSEATKFEVLRPYEGLW